jgi:ribonuclease M5
MIAVKEAIIVEGTYDQMRLKQYLDAVILPVHGFSVFKDKETLALIRALALRQGIVVLTDSDRAGFLIRNHIKSAVPAPYVKHAYIPEIPGKERRKARPGKAGLLGVEGVPPETVIEALSKAGCLIQAADLGHRQRISKQDLYALGLSGRPDSAKKRQALQKALSFPSRLSANALLEALNVLMDYETLQTALEALTEYFDD